jgi:hypothetical protein
MTCLQPVQVTDRHTDVGGVGALAPTPLQQATLAQPIKQERQQPLSLAIGEQPRAELGEHRGIEARVTKIEAQRVLPVQPCSHRVGGLPVGEALDELQYQHQRQPRRRPRRPPPCREQLGELLISEQRPQRIAHPHHQASLGEHRPGNPRRLSRDLRQPIRTQRHRRPPGTMPIRPSTP